VDNGQSALSLITSELDNLLSQLNFFANCSAKDDPMVLPMWSDVDNFVNQVANLLSQSRSWPIVKSVYSL
jgi:hypothetical protein